MFKSTAGTGLWQSGQVSFMQGIRSALPRIGELIHMALFTQPMKPANLIPGFQWRFGVLNQLQMVIGDHAFVGESLKVDDPIPKLSAEENDRNVLHAAG